MYEWNYLPYYFQPMSKIWYEFKSSNPHDESEISTDSSKEFKWISSDVGLRKSKVRWMEDVECRCCSRVHISDECDSVLWKFITQSCGCRINITILFSRYKQWDEKHDIVGKRRASEGDF